MTMILLVMKGYNSGLLTVNPERMIPFASKQLWDKVDAKILFYSFGSEFCMIHNNSCVL